MNELKKRGFYVFPFMEINIHNEFIVKKQEQLPILQKYVFS